MKSSRSRQKVFLGKAKLISAIMLVLVVFLGVNLVKSWQRSHEVNQEMNNLQADIKNLQQENMQFKQLINYFNSSAYIEEKARVDLGLKKSGEKVVVVPTALPDSSTAMQNSTTTKLTSNPGRWWKYFFQ